MGFEPQKFFIGLVDFFSIFLPGALLAYLGRHRAMQIFVGPKGSFDLNTTENVVVFLFASYLIGHFVFLIGSYLDELYDLFRKATRFGQIQRLADGKKLYPESLRRLAESPFFFGKNADDALMRVLRLKAVSFQPYGTAVNGYQWCRALLSKQHSDGLVAVERYEADSKFFRSFVIGLVIAAPVYWFKDYPTKVALVCLVLIFLALMRYIDQRFKGTEHAYRLVLTLDALNQKPKPTTPKNDGLSHASGVVYNGREPVEYLLVQSSSKREWVLPRGRIEPGEDVRQAAVRGVLEETGYWARVVGWIRDEDLLIDGDKTTTRIFLMELLDQAEKEDRNENRQTCWKELMQAQHWATAGLTPGFFAEADRLVREERRRAAAAREPVP